MLQFYNYSYHPKSFIRTLQYILWIACTSTRSRYFLSNCSWQNNTKDLSAHTHCFYHSMSLPFHHLQHYVYHSATVGYVSGQVHNATSVAVPSKTASNCFFFYLCMSAPCCCCFCYCWLPTRRSCIQVFWLSWWCRGEMQCTAKINIFRLGQILNFMISQHPLIAQTIPCIYVYSTAGQATVVRKVTFVNQNKLKSYLQDLPLASFCWIVPIELDPTRFGTVSTEVCFIPHR